MNTPQNNTSYGFRITINWENPTTIIKEKIIYEPGSTYHCPTIDRNLLSVNTEGKLESQKATKMIRELPIQ